MGRTNWSKCVKLYEDLQKDEPGILRQIQSVEEVDFENFISSLHSMNEEKRNREVQAVHEVLKISQHLQIATFCWCNLGEVHLKLFLDVFAGVKLTKLNVSGNEKISSDGWLLLGKIVKQSGSTELVAQWCNLTFQHFEKLVEGMNGAKLTKLDVTGNKELSSKGWLLIGKIIEQSRLMDLRTMCCDLTFQHLEKLIEGMNGAKLTRLNVYNNKELSSDGWLLIGKIIRQSESMELEARSCDLTSQNVEKLLEGMDGAKLTRLDVSENKELPPDGWLLLGRIIKQSGSMELEAQYCDLTSRNVEKLAEGMNGSKLSVFDITGNSTISPEGWFSLGRLVKQNGLKKLLAMNSVKNAKCIPNLVEGMDGAKLDRLDMMSSIFSDFRPPFTPSLLKLLPLVNENLDLSRWKFNKQQQERLQRKLDEEQLTMLTIELWKFGRRLELRADARIQSQGSDDSITTEANGRKRPNQDLNAAEGNVRKRKKVKRFDPSSSTHDFSSRSRQNPHLRSRYDLRRNPATRMSL